MCIRDSLGNQAEACDQLKSRNVGQRQTETDVELQVSNGQPGEVKRGRAISKNVAEHEAAVDERQKGQKDIEVGSRTMRVATEPPSRPRQRDQNSDEPVDRDQPGGLNGQRKGRVQKDEGVLSSG